MCDVVHPNKLGHRCVLREQRLPEYTDNALLDVVVLAGIRLPLFTAGRYLWVVFRTATWTGRVLVPPFSRIQSIIAM